MGLSRLDCIAKRANANAFGIGNSKKAGPEWHQPNHPRLRSSIRNRVGFSPKGVDYDSPGRLALGLDLDNRSKPNGVT